MKKISPSKSLKKKVHSMAKWDEPSRKERGLLRQKVHKTAGKKLKTHTSKDSERLY